MYCQPHELFHWSIRFSGPLGQYSLIPGIPTWLKHAVYVPKVFPIECSDPTPKGAYSHPSTPLYLFPPPARPPDSYPGMLSPSPKLALVGCSMR